MTFMLHHSLSLSLSFSPSLSLLPFILPLSLTHSLTNSLIHCVSLSPSRCIIIWIPPQPQCYTLPLPPLAHVTLTRTSTYEHVQGHLSSALHLHIEPFFWPMGSVCCFLVSLGTVFWPPFSVPSRTVRTLDDPRPCKYVQRHVRLLEVSTCQWAHTHTHSQSDGRTDTARSTDWTLYPLSYPEDSGPSNPANNCHFSSYFILSYSYP